jgi:hypothetical protein
MQTSLTLRRSECQYQNESTPVKSWGGRAGRTRRARDVPAPVAYHMVAAGWWLPGSGYRVVAIQTHTPAMTTAAMAAGIA